MPKSEAVESKIDIVKVSQFFGILQKTHGTFCNNTHIHILPKGASRIHIELYSVIIQNPLVVPDSILYIL
jgi:hypothetical protein